MYRQAILHFAHSKNAILPCRAFLDLVDSFLYAVVNEV